MCACVQLISVLARRLMDLTLLSILEGLASPPCMDDGLPTATTVECIADDVDASEEDTDLSALPCAQVSRLDEIYLLIFAIAVNYGQNCSLHYQPRLILY